MRRQSLRLRVRSFAKRVLGSAERSKQISSVAATPCLNVTESRRVGSTDVADMENCTVQHVERVEKPAAIVRHDSKSHEVAEMDNDPTEAASGVQEADIVKQSAAIYSEVEVEMANVDATAEEVEDSTNTKPNGIRKLPSELLEAVFDYLVPVSADVHATRATCLKFKACSWPAFGKTLNNTVFHPLCATSLAALHDLASCNEVVPYVRQLQLSTARYSQAGWYALQHWLYSERCLRIWEREAANVWYNTMVSICALRVEQGYVRKALQEAFEKLRRVEKVVVVSVDNLASPPQVSSRWRETRAHQVFDRAWKAAVPLYSEPSAKAYLAKAHQPFISPSPTDSADKHLLWNLTEAIAAASPEVRQRILSFSTSGSVELTAIPDGTTLRISTSTFGQPIADPIFPSLTYLDLTLSYSTDTMDEAVPLPAFLEGMPSLQNLQLTFPPPEKWGLIDAGNNGAALKIAEGFLQLSHLPPFKHLHTLKLENLHLYSPTYFQAWLLNHESTLRDMTVGQMTLLEYEWPAYIDWLGKKLSLDVYTHISLPKKMGLVTPVSERHKVPWEAWRAVAKKVYARRAGEKERTRLFAESA